MDLRQIRYFTVVAQERNISRAARRLHITQPALSRQIHAMEDRLGIKLIERQGRSIRLTPAADELLPRCIELISRVSDLEEFTSILSGQRQPVVRVGASAHYIETIMSKVLQQHRLAHPEVDIILSEHRTGDLGALLDHNEIHLALGADRVMGQYATRPLPPCTILLTVPQGHRFESRTSLELSEAVGEPLLVLSRGYLTREVFESACHLAQLVPFIRHESESVHTLISLVQANYGVAIVQSNARTRDPAIPITVDGEPVRIELAAAWNPKTHLHQVIVELIDTVETVMHEVIG